MVSTIYRLFVAGDLLPVNTTSPLYVMSISCLVNVAWQPLSANCPIDSNPSLPMFGNRCTSRTFFGNLERDGIRSSAVCEDDILDPSGSSIVIGLIAFCLLITSALSGM